jgi:hypothetical protein
MRNKLETFEAVYINRESPYQCGQLVESPTAHDRGAISFAGTAVVVEIETTFRKFGWHDMETVVKFERHPHVR